MRRLDESAAAALVRLIPTVLGADAGVTGVGIGVVRVACLPEAEARVGSEQRREVRASLAASQSTGTSRTRR